MGVWFKQGAVFLQVVKQLGEELVEREIAHYHTLVEVFEIEVLVEKLPELAGAEIEFSLDAFIVVERVFVTAGRGIGQGHARLNPCLQT